MACLRGIDPNTLDNVNHVMGANAFRRTSVFVPVIDGDLIIERPLETLRKGTVNGVSSSLDRKLTLYQYIPTPECSPGCYKYV